MKKVLIIALLCFTVVIAAKEKETEEVNAFDRYMNEQTQESFLEAYNKYGKLASEGDQQARLMLAYLNLYELQRQIEIMENQDSLHFKMKFSLANLLLEIGKFDRSIEIYTSINEQMPKWSCPWRHRGEAYFKSGKYEEAENALEKAIETRKTHYDAYVMLADVQNHMGNHKEALKTFEKGKEYRDKDIENPEEELPNDADLFIYLEILEANEMDQKYSELKQKLKKKYPDDTRLN